MDLLTKIFWACVGILTPLIVISLIAIFWSWFSEQHKLVKRAWGKK